MSEAATTDGAAADATLPSSEATFAEEQVAAAERQRQTSGQGNGQGSAEGFDGGGADLADMVLGALDVVGEALAQVPGAAAGALGGAAEAAGTVTGAVVEGAGAVIGAVAEGVGEALGSLGN
jgi:hypothetical protein